MTKLEGEALDNYYKHAIFHEYDRLFSIACRDGADKVKEATNITVTRIEWLRVTRDMMMNALADAKFKELEEDDIDCRDIT